MPIDQVLQNEINKIYGESAGRKTGAVLIPAFLGDFYKVIDKADVGKVVSEEYMTEDKRMHVIFSGMKKLAGKGAEPVIISCICNDIELLLERAKEK